MYFRKLLMLAVCFISLTGAMSSVAVGQDEDSSQRLLPLPERNLPDMAQQMELLKKLRSLVESRQKEQDRESSDERSSKKGQPGQTKGGIEEKSSGPSPSPEQMKRLQDALKNLTDQLPPGMVPPDLSSIPPEQIQQALENPVIRQQMREMLQKFSKDGILPSPENGEQRDSLPGLPPVPKPNEPPTSDVEKNAASRNAGPEAESNPSETERPEDVQPDSKEEKTPPKSESAMNQLKDFLKNLAGQPAEPPEDSASAKPSGQRDISEKNNQSSKSPSTSDSQPDRSRPAESDSTTPSPPKKPLRRRDRKQAPGAGNAESGGAAADKAQADKAGTDKAGTDKAGTDKAGTDKAPDLRAQSSDRGPLTNGAPEELGDTKISNRQTPDTGESPPETRAAQPGRPMPDPAVDSPRVSDDSAQVEQNGRGSASAFSNRDPGTGEVSKSVGSGRGESNRRSSNVPPSEKEVSGKEAAGNEPIRSGSSGSGSSGINSSEPLPDFKELQEKLRALQDIVEQMKSAPAEDRGAGFRGSMESSRSAPSSPEALPDVAEFLKNELKELDLQAGSLNGKPGSRSGALSGSGDQKVAPGGPISEELLQGQRVPRPNPKTVPEIPGRSDSKSLSQNQAPSESNAPSDRSGSARAGSARAGSARSGKDANKNSGAVPSGEVGENSSAALNLRKELSEKGIVEAFKRMVERAEEEIRQEEAQSIEQMEMSRNSEGSVVPKSGSSGPLKMTPEMKGSVIQMLDNLKDDMADIVKDARTQKSPRVSARSEGMSPGSAPPESTFDSLKKVASEVLAGPSKPKLQSASPPESAVGASVELLNSGFDLTPMFLLGGILGAVTLSFYGLRFLKTRSARVLALQAAGPLVRPSEIQDRADVIRAFHQFAMRSTKSVQKWWTHRAVERLIATTAPEKKAAVEVLANAYEQARYLPQGHELSSEQLQSARTALQQCTGSAS